MLNQHTLSHKDTLKPSQTLSPFALQFLSCHSILWVLILILSFPLPLNFRLVIAYCGFLGSHTHTFSPFALKFFYCHSIMLLVLNITSMN